MDPNEMLSARFRSQAVNQRVSYFFFACDGDTRLLIFGLYNKLLPDIFIAVPNTDYRVSSRPKIEHFNPKFSEFPHLVNGNIGKAIGFKYDLYGRLSNLDTLS
jgi:hypothetical protein